MKKKTGYNLHNSLYELHEFCMIKSYLHLLFKKMKVILKFQKKKIISYYDSLNNFLKFCK